MHKSILVNTSVANLYKTPSFKSELVTQALYGEELLKSPSTVIRG